jgi:hypothetical protein
VKDHAKPSKEFHDGEEETKETDKLYRKYQPEVDKLAK